MKCITYGWLIFLLIILSIVCAPIGLFSPMFAGTIYLAGVVLLHFYWIYGWVSSCNDGYLGGLKKV